MVRGDERLANQLPVVIIAEMLGVPSEHRERFRSVVRRGCVQFGMGRNRDDRRRRRGGRSHARVPGAGNRAARGSSEAMI